MGNNKDSALSGRNFSNYNITMHFLGIATVLNWVTDALAGSASH